MASHSSASSILLGWCPMLASVLSISKELLVHSKVAHGAHLGKVAHRMRLAMLRGSTPHLAVLLRGTLNTLDRGMLDTDQASGPVLSLKELIRK